MLDVLAAGLTMAVSSGAIGATIKGVGLLQLAAMLDRLDLVLSLFQLGAPANSKNRRGRTPLFYARSPRVARTLMRHGASPGARDQAGHTALHFAAAHGRTGTVETLRESIDVNARDLRGQTPLHAAASRGHAETVQALLAEGANPNALDRKGRHPLFYAVAGGHLGCAQRLIDGGANLDVVDDRGTSWLAVASPSDAPMLQAMSQKAEEDEAMRPWNTERLCITRAPFYRKRQEQVLGMSM